MNRTQTEQVLSVTFNQDASCFVVGTDSGFRIFTSRPLVYAYRRDFSGGLGLVEMLYRSTSFALVGGGKLPYASPEQVFLWDDGQMSVVGRLQLNSQVLNIKLRRDYLVVMTVDSATAYTLHDLQPALVVPTCVNSTGLCSISVDPYPLVLACPGVGLGTVSVHSEAGLGTIAAHRSEIACLAVNQNGSLLITASTTGTCIRVFDCETRRKTYEVRRGLERVRVTCLCVHPLSTWFACLSEKGTLHVFGLGSNAERNQHSSLRAFQKFLPQYFSSSWSFAQFRIKESQATCAFSTDGEHIIIISSEGAYYSVSFCQGGDCQLETHSDVLDLIHW